MVRRNICFPLLLILAAWCKAACTAVSDEAGPEGESKVLIDAEGNAYRTVRIGTQFWMAENLRCTKAPDGTVVDSYLPDLDSANVLTHGRLYDWETAVRIAPIGWHLPTDLEWQVLCDYLGEKAGAKLKDTLLWNAPNTGATNETGFCARPAGYWNDGGFENMFGLRAVFWSATRQESDFAWSRTLSHENAELRRAVQHLRYGFSVRCLKDTLP